MYSNSKQLTILILDSGVGGLFIYNTIYRIFPGAYYLYFFDNKFFPYGELSESFITQRVIFIIETMFSLYECDLVIIACNTISVVSLEILKTQFKCPVIGIIPEIRLATKYTKNGVIGVLATYRTIRHSYVLDLIKYFSNQYTIMLLEASELVDLAEFKMYGKLVSKSNLMEVFKPWLKLKQFPDTVVLGCTHFSLLKEELMEILPVINHLIDFELYCFNYIRFYLSNFFKINNIIVRGFPYKYNISFCTMNTSDILYLKSILLFKYNFFSLEILLI